MSVRKTNLEEPERRAEGGVDRRLRRPARRPPHQDLRQEARRRRPSRHRRRRGARRHPYRRQQERHRRQGRRAMARLAAMPPGWSARRSPPIASTSSCASCPCSGRCSSRSSPSRWCAASRTGCAADGCSPVMVRKARRLLGSLLADAQERGLVAQNVVRSLRTSRRGKERAHRAPPQRQAQGRGRHPVAGRDARHRRRARHASTKPHAGGRCC